jgi:hypothetical protein
MNTIIINNLKYSQSEFLFNDAPIKLRTWNVLNFIMLRRNQESKTLVRVHEPQET